MICRHLRITGRVQGVGYRDWAVRTARGLELTGWVRNRGDGSVEAVVAGPADAVDAFIAACRQGPIAARVNDIAVTDADPPTGHGFAWTATV